MKKNILVTGGAGLIGSYLSKRLMQEGHKLTIVDNLSNGKKINLPKECKFYEIDLISKDSLNKISDNNFDAVFHCAAQAGNAISWKNPKLDMESNQLATLNILNFCVKKSINRILFTSSMSAYGEPSEFPTKETEVMMPDSFYAVHKLASEHYLRIYAKEYGLKYTTFRLYTTYGYGQNLDNIDQGLLSIYLAYIVKKKPILVKGSKNRTRDIVHVSDVVEAMVLALDNKNAFNKTYNLGSGKEITVEKIIELLTEGMGYKKDVYPTNYTEKTQGDPFNTLANIENAKKDLGWKPKISPIEGINLTVKKYKQD